MGVPNVPQYEVLYQGSDADPEGYTLFVYLPDVKKEDITLEYDKGELRLYATRKGIRVNDRQGQTKTLGARTFMLDLWHTPDQTELLDPGCFKTSLEANVLTVECKYKVSAKTKKTIKIG